MVGLQVSVGCMGAFFFNRCSSCIFFSLPRLLFFVLVSQDWLLLLFCLFSAIFAIVMAAVVPVASLNDALHRIKLHVRVIRTWQGRGKNAVVNFVLLDNQGSAIQGSIPGKDYRKIYTRFAEGRLCELARFTVDLAGQGFQAVSHTFSLLLSSSTAVYPLSAPLPDIPLRYFELKQLEDVGVSLACSSDIMDVVARIVGFRPIDTVQGKDGLARVMTLYIANERDFIMDVALWEEFIDKFDIPALVARSEASPVVVACNSLQLREYKARWSLKTFIGTQFHFDEAIPEVAAFRSRLPSHLPPIFHDVVAAAQCMHRFNTLSLPRSQPKRVTLLQLANVDRPSDSDVFECVAEIADVITRFDWYYWSCPKCFRKVYDPERRPYCDYSDCVFYKTRIIPIPWYRFTIKVKDQTRSSRFVLLGRQGEMAVGPRAASLLSEQKSFPDDAPPTLLAIIGKRFMFSISGREVAGYGKYQSYTVQTVQPVPAEELPLLIAGPAHPAQPAHATSDPIAPEAASATPTDAGMHPSSAVDFGPSLTEAAVIHTLPAKRLASDLSASHVVSIRDVKRRLDFSSPDEGRLTCDATEPASSRSKEKVP